MIMERSSNLIFAVTILGVGPVWAETWAIATAQTAKVRRAKSRLKRRVGDMEFTSMG
jgi:hypothetical protein